MYYSWQTPIHPQGPGSSILPHTHSLLVPQSPVCPLSLVSIQPSHVTPTSPVRAPGSKREFEQVVWPSVLWRTGPAAHAGQVASQPAGEPGQGPFSAGAHTCTGQPACPLACCHPRGTRWCQRAVECPNAGPAPPRMDRPREGGRKGCDWGDRVWEPTSGLLLRSRGTWWPFFFSSRLPGLLKGTLIPTQSRAGPLTPGKSPPSLNPGLWREEEKSRLQNHFLATSSRPAPPRRCF